MIFLYGKIFYKENNYLKRKFFIKYFTFFTKILICKAEMM